MYRTRRILQNNRYQNVDRSFALAAEGNWVFTEYITMSFYYISQRIDISGGEQRNMEVGDQIKEKSERKEVEGVHSTHLGV